MATCKDCFHFEVCDSGRHIGEYELDDGVYSEGVENECLTFKPTADVVEVVRCKDCKFAYKNRFLGEYHCEKTNCKIKAHHFCGQGIRK